MNSRKFSLRSLFGWIIKKKRPDLPIVFASARRGCTSARDRVRSGIEPLEGRIAPAILLNAHTLAFNDLDGDLVKVTFSRDIFDLTSGVVPSALEAVFKFSAGKAHLGAANATDDVPQQLQLIDLGSVPTRLVRGVPQSVVGGVSFTVTSDTNPNSGQALGDGFAAIGAIKAGANPLGAVMIDGDLGQIDAGVGTSKVGVGILVTQSIGKFGTTTQAAAPVPNLNSDITGRVGRLVVIEDVKGYFHVTDATQFINGSVRVNQRGTIGQITIGGSLTGNPTVAAASDNTGRIEAFDIGNVTIGTDSTDGIFGGGGKNSGTLVAVHSLGNVTVSGSVEGGGAESAGAIASNGTIGIIKIGGDFKGGTALRAGTIASNGAIASITIGSAGAPHDIIGGSGESSASILIGTNLGALHVFGNITGGSAFHSGSVLANGSIVSALVDGSIVGGADSSGGSIEAARSLGSVVIGANLTGGDGAGSGTVTAGASLARITVFGDVIGGKGAHSGAILGGQNPASSVKTLGNVTLVGALTGGEGIGSGSIISGGTIAAVKIGTGLTSGVAIQGGIGAVSGTVFAHGAIASVTALRGITGGTGAGSASIQAGGSLGFVSIAGDVTGGTGVESASIFSHEDADAARPIAGNIGTVSITGKLKGVGARSAFIKADGGLGRAILGSMEDGAIVSGAGDVRAGATASIAVQGAIDGGAIHIGARLGSLTVDAMTGADIRVAQDIGSLRVNGSVLDSRLTTGVAIGSVTIDGDVTNSSILAGYDIAGGAVNADAQIGRVRVTGNWTASTLAAGVIDGDDNLFGTLDDALIPVPNSARIIAQIASVIIDGNVDGSAASGDHFGFVSQRIGAFMANGVAAGLTATGGQSFEVGPTGDTTVREVATLV